MAADPAGRIGPARHVPHRARRRAAGPPRRRWIDRPRPLVVPLLQRGRHRGHGHRRRRLRERVPAHPEGWRIARQHCFPQYSGTHADGWTNIDGAELPMVPYHFTVDEVGVPLPPSNSPTPGPDIPDDELASTIAALEDEGAVRNLVHAYGYYVDRRMWTDVVELCTADVQVDLAPGGSFRGADGIREAMLTMGPEGLETGQLNDRPLFDTLVRILPGGLATTRSIELGMLGDATRHEAAWEVRILTTRCRKHNGVWRLDEVRLERVMHADYFRGWADADLRTPSAPTADDPLSASARAATDTAVATGAAAPATSTAATDPAAPATTPPAVLRTQLDRALAYDGVENVSSAYGYYIDDFQWTEMAALFAENGNKQSPFAGYYFGRDRITAAATSFWGSPPETRPGISYHWRTQPVISISADGRSASFRVRLFQPRTHKLPSRAGDFYAAGFHSGMYPNDQAVLEDGQWRLWSLTIDEPYFVSLDWRGGWASVPAATGTAPKPSRLMEIYPPDVPMTALGRRARHFRGGTGDVREWPEILPMWFHYRNPVSGRTPEHFWPDGVPTRIAPHTSMTAHGYQLPPDGPAAATAPE
ncbi:nuclear transport factor 2 family protein [Microbacterium elymi]|uniref:Nuclear transport factor 2 family protein n=2 Tax=Microbacterium elymi TaxID=2909587 RepID=A0ABY5NN29_9MICO|nr:nuclear transport factor 2 family protein [Microbacterium elymi]UUT36446.1 nuclear transport factor 2 family protein [Microbacterium elymi]